MSLMPRLHVLADSWRRRWRPPSGPEAYGEYFWRRLLKVVVVLKIEARNLFHIATRVSKLDLIHASAGLVAHCHRRSLRRPAPPSVRATFGKSDEMIPIGRPRRRGPARFQFLQCNGLLSAFFDVGFLCGLSIVSV